MQKQDHSVVKAWTVIQKANWMNRDIYGISAKLYTSVLPRFKIVQTVIHTAAVYQLLTGANISVQCKYSHLCHHS